MTRDLTLQPSVSAEAIAAGMLKIEVKIEKSEVLKIESLRKLKFLIAGWVRGEGWATHKLQTHIF